ncbi:MAG: hypothetical protein K6E51_07380 [Treponema sp.]|nr:hypothetical protein [Treponema sp.]
MKKVLTFLVIAGITLVRLFAADNLPMGYKNVRLGMTVDEVKETLKKTAEFGYHGDRDVSLLPGENRVLIETDALAGHVISYLDRCWFQFYEDKLYIITLNMNKEKVDHYTLFSTLTEKYGNPVALSPDKSVWENDAVRMSLEKPLTIKYVDMKVFNSLQEKSLVNKAASEQTRDMFLEGL